MCLESSGPVPQAQTSPPSRSRNLARYALIFPCPVRSCTALKLSFSRSLPSSPQLLYSSLPLVSSVHCRCHLLIISSAFSFFRSALPVKTQRSRLTVIAIPTLASPAALCACLCIESPLLFHLMHVRYPLTHLCLMTSHVSASITFCTLRLAKLSAMSLLSVCTVTLHLMFLHFVTATATAIASALITSTRVSRKSRILAT